MSTNVKIIHAHDFIKATPEGQLDFEESKRLLTEIASVAASSVVDYEIILDTRKAQIEMSATDLWYLATELSNFRRAFSRKIAVLCPVEKFDRAAFFALCAENRGFQISAFASYDDAIEWLMLNGT